MRALITANLLLLTLAAAARAQDSGVQSIELPRFMPHLPEGPGREAFASACLSCHSTRYIAMQPLVPQPKWEENIKKMIKTYGAPIAEDQVTPLAQYVMAMQRAEADPLVRVTENPKPRKIEAAGGDASRGEKVFAEACASCHGAGGKGDGPAMKNLLPVATNLAAGRFTRDAILRSITHGVPGTAMPAFPSLSDEQTRDVVAFTMRIGQGEPAGGNVADEVKQLFATHCASCHGASGGGDGFNAPTLSRAPTNFHLRQPSNEHAFAAIAEGMPGTAMPSWKAKLSHAQMKQLTEFVRTLYVATNPSP